jgi:hypothetical protein
VTHTPFDDLVADMARQIIAQIEQAQASATPAVDLTRFLSIQYALLPEAFGPAEQRALDIITDEEQRRLLSRSILAAGIAYARGDDPKETAQ